MAAQAWIGNRRVGRRCGMIYGRAGQPTYGCQPRVGDRHTPADNQAGAAGEETAHNLQSRWGTTLMM
jgi:hypothetical protein